MKKSIYIILILVVCFCVFYGIRYVENPVETMSAVSEVYENKINTKGYVVKSEQIYTAPVTGRVYHYVEEGTRVGRNRVLSTVYTGNISEETLQELNNINIKIAELQNENTDSAYMAGGMNSEEDIENIKNGIIRAKNSGNIKKIASYKAQINAIVTGDSKSVATTNLDELIAKKNQLEASIISGKNDIYSGMSGVFSKNVDSLEEILTPQNVMTYKVADFYAVTSAVKENMLVATSGQPVCKVVNNHTWYVMLTVERSVAESLKAGQEVKVRFGELPGVSARGSIAYISTEDSATNENVIVIKCEEYCEGVYSLRFSAIELILESYEGYRIPISAIRVADSGDRGVLVKSAGSQIFKPCKIVYTDTLGGTVIVSPQGTGNDMLREYDNIVVGEK